MEERKKTLSETEKAAPACSLTQSPGTGGGSLCVHLAAVSGLASSRTGTHDSSPFSFPTTSSSLLSSTGCFILESTGCPSVRGVLEVLFFPLGMGKRGLQDWNKQGTSESFSLGIVRIQIENYLFGSSNATTLSPSTPRSKHARTSPSRDCEGARSPCATSRGHRELSN